MLCRLFSVLLLVLAELGENRGFLTLGFFLFRDRSFYRLLGSVIDDTVNHTVVILHLHFCIFQMIVDTAEVGQLLVTNAVNVMI